jgi:signal transduction histidine kinase
MKLMETLDRQSRTFVTVLGFVLVGLVGTVEYLSHQETLALYLFPILLVARFADRRAGVAVSLAGAAAWLAAELPETVGHPHWLLSSWNIAMRVAVFLVLTYAISGMIAARKRQEELTQFIVHDLRSPLTNVLTGLETLQSLEESNMDQTEKELVDMALVSAGRMLALTNSLLDVPRLENGKMPLNLSNVDPDMLVESAMGQVSLWARSNEVTLKPLVDTGGLTLHADWALTERVLVNLLGNALKFSPPGSTVTVRVAPFEADRIAVTVMDQGPGIPRQWAEKIFDKFAQVEARKAKEAVGTGLGLTFCKLAVEAQGGRIWLESEVGQGTNITFTLPVAVPLLRAYNLPVRPENPLSDAAKSAPVLK